MSNILPLPPRAGVEPAEAADVAAGHTEFSSIPTILAELRAGRIVLILDDEDRENEGDLTIAAEKVSPEIVNFMATHGRGLICVALTPESCDALRLPFKDGDKISSPIMMEMIDPRKTRPLLCEFARLAEPVRTSGKAVFELRP